jgi:hypothetical protein
VWEAKGGSWNDGGGGVGVGDDVGVRHGYLWVPTDQAHVVPDKWVRPTTRPSDLSVGQPT